MPIVKEIYNVDNQEIIILVDLENYTIPTNNPYEETRDGLLDKVREGKDTFSKGIKLARNCAAIAVKELGEMAEGLKPNEFTLEVGIKLDGELGASLVKIGGEAHMQVSMMWKLKP